MNDCTKLIEALKEIRKTSMGHPACDLEAFEARNIDYLAEQGGDVCDWTMIAITADDALREGQP